MNLQEGAHRLGERDGYGFDVEGFAFWCIA